MNIEPLQKEYEKQSEFEEINEGIISYGRNLAWQVCNATPDVINPKSCMILFRKNNDVQTLMKEDYHTAAVEAVELLEQGIPSIIYTFQDYPPVIDYVIVSEKTKFK